MSSSSSSSTEMLGLPQTLPRPRSTPASKSYYQDEIYRCIRENPAFTLTLREIMRMRMIPKSKASIMVAAIKKMYVNGEVARVGVANEESKTKWLDGQYKLRTPSGSIVWNM